jgi:hypothetical protein
MTARSLAPSILPTITGAPAPWPQPDITGMVGQDAQGNEPSNHNPYLFPFAGAAWQTQYWVRRVARLYNNTPAGIPGNDDFTGQCLYPVRGNERPRMDALLAYSRADCGRRRTSLPHGPQAESGLGFCARRPSPVRPHQVLSASPFSRCNKTRREQGSSGPSMPGRPQPPKKSNLFGTHLFQRVGKRLGNQALTPQYPTRQPTPVLAVSSLLRAFRDWYT